MRNLTDNEGRILEMMFTHLPDFTSQLRDQAKHARVEQIDEAGSLQFHLDEAAHIPININERVPITAIFDDDDGIPIYILLHVKEGRLFELEVYKADGSSIVTAPVSNNLYF